MHLWLLSDIVAISILLSYSSMGRLEFGHKNGNSNVVTWKKFHSQFFCAKKQQICQDKNNLILYIYLFSFYVMPVGVLSGKVGTGMCGPDSVPFRRPRFTYDPFLFEKLV